MTGVTIATATVTARHTHIPQHKLLGKKIAFAWGNPGDRGYQPKVVGTVQGVYYRRHIGEVILASAMIGEAHSYAEVFPDGCGGYETTNARMVGVGDHQVKDLVGAIHAFGLNE